MASESQKKLPSSSSAEGLRFPLSILVLTYPGVELLDFAGAIEAFTHARSSAQVPCFKATFAGLPQIRTSNWLTITPDISYEYALKTISEYDIVLIPGAPNDVVDTLLKDTHPVVKIVKAFSELGLKQEATSSGSTPSYRPRVIYSVCTGAYPPAYLGLLKGKTCTTHWSDGSGYQKLLDEKGGGKYVRTSWVDSGALPNGVSMVSAGGVTNGIDGALHLVEKFCVSQAKESVIAIMDYTGLERKGIISD